MMYLGGVVPPLSRERGFQKERENVSKRKEESSNDEQPVLMEDVRLGMSRLVVRIVSNPIKKKSKAGSFGHGRYAVCFSRSISFQLSRFLTTSQKNKEEK